MIITQTILNSLIGNSEVGELLRVEDLEEMLDDEIKCESSHSGGYDEVCSIEVTHMLRQGCTNEQRRVCANRIAIFEQARARNSTCPKCHLDCWVWWPI